MPDTAADALILDAEGPPALTAEAARILARIIRAARDNAPSAPQAGVEDVAERRSREGLSAA
jgi:hypothetical protein